jgi:porphobilinogen synthase
MRRNRQTPWSRNIVRENTLSVHDLIWPLFVIEGEQKTEDISAMPDVKRYSIDLLVEQAKIAQSHEIPAIALFPATPAQLKNEQGTEATNPDNLICRAIKEIKSACPNLGIIADVALDPYTSHGHDGIMDGNTILNDETIDILCQQSLVQAAAGVDVIAPSDMMDGRIKAIRQALDENGYSHVQIISYAAKYASAFYGPFRDAVGSGGLLKGDKKTYQMDPANSNEALREIKLDIEEGADMIMVKPGLPYLDIIKSAKDTYKVPTLAYNVSGEYAMLKIASQQGVLDYDKAMLEMLLCFKRAGTDAILTYSALDAAKILNK